jgi:hypothetical protein
MDSTSKLESEKTFYIKDKPYVTLSTDPTMRLYDKSVDLTPYKNLDQRLFHSGMPINPKDSAIFVNGFHMPYRLLETKDNKKKLPIQKNKKSKPPSDFSKWVPVATHMCSNYYEQEGERKKRKEKEQAIKERSEYRDVKEFDSESESDSGLHFESESEFSDSDFDFDFDFNQLEEKEEKEEELTCSVIGAKISKSLVRNAISRIFADPAQSIMEPISNSIDAINAKNGQKTKIGKFGMGFFSFLYWLIDNPSAMITIKTTSLSDEGLLVHLHIEFKEIDGIVQFRYRYAGNNRVDTGTIMELSGIKIETLRNFAPYISRYYYNKTKVTHNRKDRVHSYAGCSEEIILKGNSNDIYEKTKDLVTVIYDVDRESQSQSTYKVIVQDHGLGISPDVFFNSMLVPSSSSKTLKQEGVVTLEELKEDQERSGIISNAIISKKLEILVGPNVVISVGYEDQKYNNLILNGNTIVIGLPRNIAVPVARNDVIIKSLEDVYPSMKHLASSMVKEYKTLIPLQNGIKNYIKTTSRSENKEFFQQALDQIEIYFKNQGYYAVRGLNDQLIKVIEILQKKGNVIKYYSSIAGISHPIEKKIADIIGYSDVFIGKYTCITDFTDEITTEPTTVGSNSLLFISPSFKERHGDQWTAIARHHFAEESLTLNIEESLNSSLESKEFSYLENMKSKTDTKTDAETDSETDSYIETDSDFEDQVDSAFILPYDSSEVRLLEKQRIRRSRRKIKRNKELKARNLRRGEYESFKTKTNKDKYSDVIPEQKNNETKGTKRKIVNENEEINDRIRKIVNGNKIKQRKGTKDVVYPLSRNSKRKLESQTQLIAKNKKQENLAKMIINLRNRFTNMRRYFIIEDVLPDITLDPECFPDQHLDLHMEILETYYTRLGIFYKNAHKSGYGQEKTKLTGLVAYERFDDVMRMNKYTRNLSLLLSTPVGGRSIMIHFSEYYKFESLVNTVDSTILVLTPMMLFARATWTLFSKRGLKFQSQLNSSIGRLANKCKDSMVFYSMLIVITQSMKQVVNFIKNGLLDNYIDVLYDTIRREVPRDKLNSILEFTVYRYKPTELLSLSDEIARTLTRISPDPFVKPVQQNYTSVKLSAIISSVFQFDYNTENVMETIELIKKTKAPDIPLQMVEIAINEGSVRDVVVSTFFELYQNSLDALRETNSVKLQDEKINIELRQIDNIDKTEASLVMTFSDTVGIAEKHIMALMIPYYSSKTGSLNATGEMGNGFFNTYRSANYVCVKTRKDNFEMSITDFPILDKSGRVVDLEKRFVSEGPEKKGNGTEITIVFNPTSIAKLTYNISTLKQLIFNVLKLKNSTIPLPKIKTKGVPKPIRNIFQKDSTTQTVEDNSIFSTVLVIGTFSDQKSYVFTNGIPFLPMTDFVQKILGRKIEGGVNFSSKCYLNLKKGSYNPVQSRDILTFNNDKDQQVTNKIYRAITDLYYLNIMRNGYTNGRKTSDAVTTAFHKGVYNKDFRERDLHDWYFIYNYRYQLQIAIKNVNTYSDSDNEMDQKDNGIDYGMGDNVLPFENIHELVNHIIENKHDYSEKLNDYTGIRPVDIEVMRLLRAELENQEFQDKARDEYLRTANIDMPSLGLDDDTYMLTLALIQSFVDTYWKISDNNKIQGFGAPKITPKIVLIPSFAVYNAYYDFNTNEITYAYNKSFLMKNYREELELLATYLERGEFNLLLDNEVYNSLFEFDDDNTLSHEIEHARRGTNHLDLAGHAEVVNFLRGVPGYDGKELNFKQCHNMVYAFIKKDDQFLSTFRDMYLSKNVRIVYNN